MWSVVCAAVWEILQGLGRRLMGSYKALGINRSVNHSWVQSVLTPRMYELGKGLSKQYFFSRPLCRENSWPRLKEADFKRNSIETFWAPYQTQVKEEKRLKFILSPYFFPFCFPGGKGIGKNITWLALAIELQIFSPIISDRFTRPHWTLKLHYSYSNILKSWSVLKHHTKQVI